MADNTWAFAALPICLPTLIQRTNQAASQTDQ